MAVNKDYMEKEEEEWDMVPNGDEENDEPPEATVETAEEETPGETPPTPAPTAPMEEQVVGLEEQQAMLGITNETTPEEIEKLLNDASKIEEKQGTPFVATTSTSTTSNDKGQEEIGGPTTSEQTQQEESQNQPEAQPSSNPTSHASQNNTPQLPGWLRSSLLGAAGVATKAFQEADQKHNLKQRTRQGLDTVGSSLRQVGTTIHKETAGIRTVVQQESTRLSQTVHKKAEELDVNAKVQAATDTIAKNATTAGETISKGAKTVAEGAKTAGESIGRGAKTAGDKVQELNKDGKVTQLVAAAAIVGASVFLASKGKPGAGAAVMATGGAAFMATEAAKESEEHRYTQGLNEDLHMD